MEEPVPFILSNKKKTPSIRFSATQRYVESWPEEFRMFMLSEVPVQMPPQGIFKTILHWLTAKSMGRLPLIFYHFSGLTIISRNEFNINWYYHIDDKWC